MWPGSEYAVEATASVEPAASDGAGGAGGTGETSAAAAVRLRAGRPSRARTTSRRAVAASASSARTRSRRRRASSARWALLGPPQVGDARLPCGLLGLRALLGRPQRARLALERRAPAAGGAHERAVREREPVEQVEALADVGEGARRQEHAQHVERLGRGRSRSAAARARAATRAGCCARCRAARAGCADRRARARAGPAPPARRRARARARHRSRTARARAARSRGPVAADAGPDVHRRQGQRQNDEHERTPGTDAHPTRVPSGRAFRGRGDRPPGCGSAGQAVLVACTCCGLEVDVPHGVEERLVDSAVIDGDVLLDTDAYHFGAFDPELAGQLFGREVVRHGSRLPCTLHWALQRQSPPGDAVVGSADQVAASVSVTIGRRSLPCGGV